MKLTFLLGLFHDRLLPLLPHFVEESGQIIGRLGLDLHFRRSAGQANLVTNSVDMGDDWRT